jgi:hypothetical protein
LIVFEALVVAGEVHAGEFLTSTLVGVVGVVVVVAAQ